MAEKANEFVDKGSEIYQGNLPDVILGKGIGKKPMPFRVCLVDVFAHF